MYADHRLLLRSLEELNAIKTYQAAQNIEEIYYQQVDINAQYPCRSEAIDDAWEDITVSLCKTIDSDLVEKIYKKYLANYVQCPNFDAL